MRRVTSILAILALGFIAAPRGATAGSATAPEIADQLRDANVVQNTQVPISVAEADLEAVWIETLFKTLRVRDEDGRILAVLHVPMALRVNLRTLAAPDLPSLLVLSTGIALLDAPGCTLIVYALVPPDGSPTGEALTQCSAGSPTTLADIPTVISGTTTSLVVPIEKVGSQFLGPEKLVRPSTASSQVYPNGRPGVFVTLDAATNSTNTFRIGSDVPPNVDCAEAPNHEECQS